MKCLVSVLLLNSFVLSKPEYTGTVVRESDEVYSEETFENFSNSSWTKQNDNLKIMETEEGQGHVLQMFASMTGDETGILETKVTLPGDCDHVAILYISFKLFLSGYNYNQSLTSSRDITDPNPDLEWSITNLRVPSSAELTLTNLARLMAREGEWLSYKMEVHINMDSSYLLRLEMWPSMTDQKQVLMVDDIIIEYAPVLHPDTEIYGLPTVFNCTALVASTATTTTTTTALVVENENTTTSIALNETLSPNNSNSTSADSQVGEKTTTEVTIINNSTSVGNETVSDNVQNGTLTADPKSEDRSLYGYAGEVVLICLTVLFLLLFIVMVVKYHLLKTRFGGYDVGESGQGRSNPGYEVQMSYRDEN